MRTVVPLALVLVVLAGCGNSPETVSSPAGSPTSSAPSRSSEPDPAPPTSASAETVARAVYWLGATDDPRGPRLYREFVRRPETAEPVRDAVEAMLSLDPNDEDYTSLWADGTGVREVRRDGTTAVVDLSSEAKKSGGGSAFEAATLQQLVHTVTAADTSLRAVRLLVEGEQVDTLWGSADASQPISRAPTAEILGPVWLDVPEGGTIDGSFGGTATVFEATVSWSLVQDGTVVEEGFSTASIGAPGRGEWSAEADVPPGEYQLRAWESSARDGSVTWLDTKSVTVTS